KPILNLKTRGSKIRPRVLLSFLLSCRRFSLFLLIQLIENKQNEQTETYRIGYKIALDKQECRYNSNDSFRNIIFHKHKVLYKGRKHRHTDCRCHNCPDHFHCTCICNQQNCRVYGEHKRQKKRSRVIFKTLHSSSDRSCFRYTSCRIRRQIDWRRIVSKNTIVQYKQVCYNDRQSKVCQHRSYNSRKHYVRRRGRQPHTKQETCKYRQNKHNIQLGIISNHKVRQHTFKRV